MLIKSNIRGNLAKIFIIFIFLLSFFSHNLHSQEEEEFIPESPQDTFKLPSEYFDYDIIAMIGAGISTGSTWDVWEDHFKIGPAMDLGVELPLTEAHITSIQIFAHSWLSKVEDGHNSLKDYFDQSYIQVSENYYSQVGISGLFLFYIGQKTSRFRMSFHVGFLFYSPNPDYNGFDFGYGFHYTINKDFIINLTRRLNLGQPDPGGSSEDIPNFLLLNVCYKINW